MSAVRAAPRAAWVAQRVADDHAEDHCSRDPDDREVDEQPRRCVARLDVLLERAVRGQAGSDGGAAESERDRVGGCGPCRGLGLSGHDVLHDGGVMVPAAE
jgi:hypothetical protein